MNTLTLDIKTRSGVSIKTHGIFAYAQHNSTQVFCVTLKKNSDPPAVWLPPELRRPDIDSLSDDLLRRMLEEAEMIQAYNITTEFALWKYTLCRLYPWFPEVPVKKLSCLAARAAYLGMGYSMHDLFVKFSGNQAAFIRENIKRKFAPGQSLSEEELKAFVRDCKTTADFEASLADYLPDLPPFELKIWHAGLQMNDRGIPVSRSCLNSRIEVAEQEIKALKEEFKAVTGIKNPMNDGAFLNFVRAYGITLKSLSANHLEKTVLTLPDGISRRMLEIRCRIAQLRLCDCKSILPLLNRESRIQGIWEHYGTPACEWTHKYIAGLDLLSGIVCNPSNRLLHSIKIQDLEQRVLSYLLENDTLTPGWYSRNLLDACKKAVCESGNTFSCGRIKVSCFSRFLKFVLPSRRDLFIYAPRLNEKQDLYCRVKSGRQMIEKQIGGGYLLALMEAALSRDIMMSVLLNAVEKGFSPILITGNELVLEHAPDESLSDFTASMMRQTPEWSKALSLHVISHAVSSWK